MTNGTLARIVIDEQIKKLVEKKLKNRIKFKMQKQLGK